MDNTLTYDMYLTTDNIVAYKGDVTNNQSDCALVFAAQVKEGTADQVVEELTAYRDGLASNDMYVEFADKVAKSADARIVSSGNFVVMVIAGVNGPRLRPRSTPPSRAPWPDLPACRPAQTRQSRPLPAFFAGQRPAFS